MPAFHRTSPRAASGCTRRQLFAAGGALLASGLLPRRLLAAEAPASPGTTLHHACIGVGGMMGGGDLRQFLAHKRLTVAAICDVDRSILAKAASLVPGARTYTDWREMLAKEGDRIDSVSATVPDHMHAVITLAALKARKHVYCQKPLCHDVAECRAVAEATVAAKGLVTQLGTQHASGKGDRMAVEMLRGGAIGKVQRVILCSNRPGAETYRLAGPRPAAAPVPAHLDWDLWLGTAPERPYAPDVYHPSKWRSWQDFGTGWSGDIGCHLFDAVWRSLDLTAPLTVTAEVQESWKSSAERRAETWPQGNHITWTFPGNERIAGKELVVEWFDGALFPPKDVCQWALDAGMQTHPYESALVIGTEGALLLPHTSGPMLLPRDRFKGFAKPNPGARNHYHHFVDACLGGEATASHFVQVGPMTEAILLGTVAVRMPGRLLTWDAAGMRFPNCAEAEKFLRRTYRAGWDG